MLSNKLFRQTLAFGIISLSSALLYPAAQGETIWLTWLLLATIVFAALLALKK